MKKRENPVEIENAGDYEELKRRRELIDPWAKEIREYCDSKNAENFWDLTFEAALEEGRKRGKYVCAIRKNRLEMMNEVCIISAENKDVYDRHYRTGGSTFYFIPRNLVPEDLL